LWDGFARKSPLNPSHDTPAAGRPLVNLSLALNYHFGGRDPASYHVFGIVLHVLTALLLWAVVARTLRLDYFHGRFDGVAGALSFAVATVWALHPLQTESVAYVTQRTELMSGFFYMATLYASLRYWVAATARKRGLWLGLASLACILGMLSKEMMASAPVVMLLFERTFVAGSFRRACRGSWPLYLGLTIGWVPLLLINFHGPVTPNVGFNLGVSPWEWWLTQPKVIWLYLNLAVWPWPLMIHYQIPLVSTLAEGWHWVLGLMLFILGTAVLVWRRSAAGFVVAWFLVVLSPTLIVPLVVETAAERRMYLPLAALVALAIVGGYVTAQSIAQFLRGRAAHRPTSPGALVATLASAGVVAFIYSLVDVHRLAAYQEELTLWQDAALYGPDDPLVQSNLGTELSKAGRQQEAFEHFERALRLRPDYHQTHYNLARALEEKGRPREAIVHYRQALQLKPDFAVAHNNLSLLLGAAGETQQAIEHCRMALEAKPDFAQAHANLGVFLANVGQIQEAIGHLEESLRLEESVDAYTNLAVAYAMAGRHADTVAAASRAVDLARARGDTARAEQLEAVLESYRRRTSSP
jgi:Flp pilus assembly protein TadD